MSSGSEHAKASVAAAIALVPIVGLPFGLPAAMGAAGGCLLGIALSPDLDQEGLNKFENKLVKYTLGLGFLWVMVWYPYARFIPHRGWASHAPVIGTLGRLVYLVAVLGVVLGLSNLRADYLLFVQTALEWLPQIVWVVAGLMVSDILHWWMDGCPLPEFFSPRGRGKKGTW